MLILKDEYQKDPKRPHGVSLKIIALLASLPVLAGLVFLGIKWSDNGNLANFFQGALASLSNVELRIEPEDPRIAASASEPLTIKVTAVENGTILKGQDIKAEIHSGDAQLNPGASDDTATTIFYFTPSTQPGEVAIDFSYGYTKKNLVVKVFDPTAPPAPEITSPTESAELGSALIRVSGKGRADTVVTVLVDGIEAGRGRTDTEGDLNLEASGGLKNGTHTLEAVAWSEDGIASPKSAPIHIKITASGPSLDTRNILIRPNQIKAGTTFDAFAPVNTNTQKVFLIVNGHQYELKDVNKTSVFSSRLPAPTTPGNYQVDFSLTDYAGNIVVVPNVTQITVI